MSIRDIEMQGIRFKLSKILSKIDLFQSNYNNNFRSTTLHWQCYELQMADTTVDFHMLSISFCFLNRMCVEGGEQYDLWIRKMHNNSICCNSYRVAISYAIQLSFYSSKMRLYNIISYCIENLIEM